MNKGFSEEMEQDFYNEQFMENAAKLIDSDLLKELEASQTQDIDEKWLERVSHSAVKSVRVKRYSRRTLSVIGKIGKSIAIFVLTICILFGGIYVSVDAAREKINNFLLGNRNSRNAIVLPVYWDSKDYVLIPMGWTCPIYPTWIPTDYSLASSGTQLDQYWWLAYHPTENIKDSICIYIWDNNYLPSIDIENYTLIAELTVHDVPATLYTDKKNGSHTIILVKDDYTVQIMGTLDSESILEVAEKMVF